MKIAFVYDRVNKFGGAERVLLALHEIWPTAPLFTAVYNPERASWANVFTVKPSFLNNIPFLTNRHELLPLITPMAFESFNFAEFDVVLSITSSEAKFIITKPKTLHICYCLTPTRYLWSGYHEYLREPGLGAVNPIAQIFMQLFSPQLRKLDFIASRRPDIYIAISHTVAARLKTYYKKTAAVIYPPVNTDKFYPRQNKSRDRYFLIVSRLVPYKRIDYAISTFNKLGLPLKIIGSGLDKGRLQKIAKQNIEFLGGDLTDEKLCWYYQNCQALIVAGEEDFGIAALEAQAAGVPVVGIKSGGISETVISGVTGELYEDYDAEALTSILKKFEPKKYLASRCRSNAVSFSKKNFQIKMKEAVENYWQWSSKL